MTKPHFFFVTGTAFISNILELNFFSTQPNPVPRTIAGLNGKSVNWDGLVVNDPFPTLMNADAWTVTKIGYPAALLPAFDPLWSLGNPTVGSVNSGINRLWEAIHALPQGTPYALGGYSQGGVVCSLTLELMRDNSSPKLADLKAAVMFGNPCREINKTFPAFGSYPGGLYSGGWDSPGSTIGGHGIFPSRLRLTSTPESWFEFIGGRTSGADPITATTSSTSTGTLAVEIVDAFLEADVGAIIGTVFSGAKAAVQGQLKSLGFAGHSAYGVEPPIGYAENAPTSFQIALEYLESIAASLSVAPILLPSQPTSTANAGWSTTLLPPAA